MVNLPYSPWVGHQHSQHESVLTPTPGEIIQGDPGVNTLQPEAYRRGQISSGTRGALLHDYCPTWF